MGPLFYFAHVIAGRIAWPAYNPLSQPVSDLTAVSAISLPPASRILYGYDILILLFCAVLLVHFGRIWPINRLRYEQRALDLQFTCCELIAMDKLMKYGDKRFLSSNTFSDTMQQLFEGL